MTSQIVDIRSAEPAEQALERPEDVQDIEEKPDPSPPQRQDAFGDEEHAEVKYKVLKWWQCGLLMVAETISLGILALPQAMARLGLGPGLAILLGTGAIASYTGFVIGQFKARFPHISSMADAGEVLMGRFGKELVGGGQMLFLIFLMASHVLTFTIALNVLSEHGTCSIVFGVVAMLLSCALSLPRTLEKMSWLSLVSFSSIVAAVFITMVAVGVQSTGADPKATVDTDLVTGFTSAANIVLSYASHNAFITFMTELKDTRDFPKSLALLQTIDISLYTTAAVVIYYYAGSAVKSPALGSAGPLIAKIAYGIALPTIVIAGVINGHIAGKAIYVRLFAGTDRMHKRDFRAVMSWVVIAVVLWVIAWIIASAIPVFDHLLSLITSLFASWFTFGLPGVFWMYMNQGLWFSSPRKIFLTVLNVIIICIGCILCGLGLYTSGKAIHDSPSSESFSCASNA
ncbi:hypothetical protein PHISP_01197 [Aspergillus sp. HF37]|nr:hypothetical protein PHISP_01197 [Aspergillus sp. HF37]